MTFYFILMTFCTSESSCVTCHRNECYVFWFSFSLALFVNLNKLKSMPSSVHSWQHKKRTRPGRPKHPVKRSDCRKLTEPAEVQVRPASFSYFWPPKTVGVCGGLFAADTAVRFSGNWIPYT